WNQTRREIPQATLVELFGRQLERTPEAVAVGYEGQQLTYPGLDRRADQLGHFFQTLGVGPGGRGGIFVGRSREMIAGLLGILKAGGAYLPMDPTYPAERLKLMLDDSDASVLIAEQRIADRLPEVSRPRVYLDIDWEAIAQYPDAAPPDATLSA